MAAFSSTFLLIVIAIADCSLATILKIERNDDFNNDDFRLPDSQCPATTQKCGNYKGDVLVSCLCYCPRIQGQDSAFFESTYVCTQVSRIRQQAGCQLLFTGETSDQRFSFLPFESIREKTVNVPANQRCSFYYGDRFYVQYLDCTGSWRSITTQSVLDTIELTPGWSTSSLKIGIKVGTTIFGNVTAGRLVRVAIQCRSEIPHVLYVSSCVMFQVDGTVECPYPKPTLSPGLTQATLPTPVTVALNTTVILPAVTTPAEPPTTKGETTQSPAEGTTTPSTEGNGNVGAETGNRKQSQRNTFIIAGSVAGGILLIALILLILWRCNSPKKRPNAHRRLEGTISRPVSHMSRSSIPVYTDASYMTPMGNFNERTRSMDNPTYRRSSDGIILTSSDLKRGSIYSDRFSPTSAPPRPPPGAKRFSVTGEVNPALSLKEEYVTMNPLYEGQVMHHKDLDQLNCSEFGVSADQVVLDTRKDPEELNETYDCPGEILNSQPRASPIPVYYVLDEPYPDSITNTFNRGTTNRGRPDGHVYDEPEADPRRRPYVVADNPRGVLYSHDYDEPPHDEELLSIRRLSHPSHGILKTVSGTPNMRYLPQSPQDDRQTQII